MKKIFSGVAIAIFAIFFASSAIVDTYADDVQVNFRITNHEAEISIRSTSDNTNLTSDDQIPDTIVTYKNAIKAVVKLIGPDGSVLKNEEYDLELANEDRTKTVDFSDVALETGEYRITSSGFNVDEKETVGNEIVFSVNGFVPKAPETGFFSMIGDFIKNDSIIVVATVLSITLLGITLRAKKGTR